MNEDAAMLKCREYEVRLRDEPEYAPAAGDTSQTQRREHRPCGAIEYITSKHAVSVSRAGTGKEVASCILLGCAGATGIHDHSALVHDDRLYVAVGQHLCALTLPALELVWAAEVDPATCFGVHLAPSRLYLLSHGELEIARVEFSGMVTWRRSGRDIFTGEMSVEPDAVEVLDFNGDRYRFSLPDGTDLTR